MDTTKWPEQRAIMMAYVGSRAYGTFEPGKSDLDEVGVCIPPIEYVIGVQNFETFKQNKPIDRTIYALKHFITLAENNNPNIIELLFLPEDCMLYQDERWVMLLANRHLFLSTKARHTFAGYAHQQMERMQTQFGDEEVIRLQVKDLQTQRRTIWLTAGTTINDGREPDMELVQQLRDIDRQINNLTKGHTGRARHGTHSGLVEAYGYDTKNGMHLIRLLESGIELLKTGNLVVRRPNAEWLLEIKHGKYKLVELMAIAKELFAELEEAATGSPLPHSPDHDGINKLLVKMILDNVTWEGRK